jgi:hypothetical protein
MKKTPLETLCLFRIFCFCFLFFQIGCSLGKITTPSAPSAPSAPSQLVTDITLGIDAGEALVQVIPSISSTVKAEVQAGAVQLNSALACIQNAVTENNGAEPQTGLGVTSCIASVNIQASATAQSYLNDFKAALNVILNYFNLGSKDAVTSLTPATLTSIKSLTPRVQALQK